MKREANALDTLHSLKSALLCSLLFFLSNCYTTYAVLEQNGFSNPLRSIKDHFSKMGGFTVLDIAVFYSIANILLVSNTFHFFSFKKKSEASRLMPSETGH